MRNLILLVVVALTTSFNIFTIPVKVLKPINIDSMSIKIRVSKYNYMIDDLNLNSSIMEKVIKVANNIGTNPCYLITLIKHESNFHSTAINKNTKAVGLIQFMPATLRWLGYNYNDVLNMTIIEQLDIVEKYFIRFKHLNNPYSLYLACFYPYAIGQQNNKGYIFGSERSMTYAYKIARVNKGFDLNKDGLITMNEYKRYHSKLIL